MWAMAGRRFDTIRKVGADPVLRRVEVSIFAFALAESATWLAMLIYAFERGGVREAGLVATLTLGVAVVVAPFAAYAGDRFRPDRALWWGYGVQTVAMAGTAIAMVAGWAWVAYVFAAATVAAVTISRPVVGALLPIIARRPSDLVAANVLVGAANEIGPTVGPLVAALVLFLAGPAAVFGVGAVMVAIAAFLTFRLRVTSDMILQTDRGRLWAEVTGGLGTVRRDRSIRSVTAVIFISSLAIGIIDVTLVNFAETRLEPGGTSAGLLATAVGLGGVIGLVVVAPFLRGARLARHLVIASTLMGVPLVLMATVDSLVPSVVLLAAAGAGVGVVAVIGSVALQRRAPQRVLARVFGITEAANMLAMAIGASVGSFLLESADFDDAALTLGVAITALALLATAAFVLVGADVEPPPPEVFDRLVADSLFAPLDVPALERLAAGAELVECAAGSTLIERGDVGDNYYLVVEGTLVVHPDHQPTVELGPGASCGEVALLDDVPRTATVTCATDVRVLAVGRDDFLEAVTGHPHSLQRARDVTLGYRAQLTEPDAAAGTATD
jgi:MFS family permease